MKTLALLASVLLIPVAGALGFVLHVPPDPPKPPTLLEGIRASSLKRAARTSETVYIIRSGPMRGQEIPGAAAAQASADRLKAFPGKFVKRECVYYSTTGRKKELFDSVILGYCTQRVVSKADVRASTG